VGLSTGTPGLFRRAVGVTGAIYAVRRDEDDEIDFIVLRQLEQLLDLVHVVVPRDELLTLRARRLIDGICGNDTPLDRIAEGNMQDTVVRSPLQSAPPRVSCRTN